MTRKISSICSLCLLAMLLGIAIACSGATVSEDDSGNRTDGTTTDASRYPKADGAFRIVTYNVGAFSKYMENSTQMVSRMLLELDPDVVGVNELDSVNARHGVNQVAELAAAMGRWNWHFGRAMAYKGGAYGNGVVTTDTIIRSYTVTLPKESGSEQRSLAVVETERYIFGSAHLDHKSAEAQLVQVEVINKWAAEKCASSGKPIFFAGDMNAHPESATISAISEKWDILSTVEYTFKSTSPTKCIDYIFHYKDSATVKVVGSKVPTVFTDGNVTLASDHLPVYVDVIFQ